MIARARAALVAVAASAALAVPGCGLEACGSFGDFTGTPEPEATVQGEIGGDLPDGLVSRASGAELVLQAVSVDGAVVAETKAKLGDRFSLKLGPGRDHFNTRIVAAKGSLVLKDFVAEAKAGDLVDVGQVGLRSTAAAQVVERYAVRERANLPSTPPQTLAAVLTKAAGEGEAQGAFRDVLSQVLAAMDPSTGEPGLAITGHDATADALATAGVDAARWTAALEAAVDASLVPIVCDPSRLRVLFTVDASGQGKDGNGAPQFIRQPTKEGKVFLGITLDPTSPVPDAAGTLRPRLTPNDLDTVMLDDGTGGDEVASDGVYSRIVDLPRGMRVLYKYTNGSPGEGFTGTEEWPGNARILVVEDVLTNSASGTPDCLVVRRDAFGDEASNKNFVNLNARLGGGDLDYDDDLGGPVIPAAPGEGLLRPGGLQVGDVAASGPLTPEGVPEARENGVCATCPAPLTVSAEDEQPPRLVAAAFVSSDQTRVVFSEDVDVTTGGAAGNYLLVDAANRPVRVTGVIVQGGTATLSHDAVDPRARFTVAVKDVTDASLQQNPIAPGAKIRVGADLTPPTIVSVRPGSIVDVNPAARPGDPSTGEVVVVTFSEVLDRISAENAASWTVEGLEVFAAFQRGRDVYVVTSQMQRAASYALDVGLVFDVAGNVMAGVAPIPFRGLSLSTVTFRAVVDFAWRSVDGTERGLPQGADLYLTGTVLKEARALDGGDLRVPGRTDVAGVPGFKLEPTDETHEGAPVHAITLRLPAGTYAYKLAYAKPGDHLDPPTTLETVTKALATRNDAGGVAVDPITLQGRDGLSYVGARLSLTGQDLPGPGVLFKRENPDEVLVVGEVDKDLPAHVVGTWRDAPFGRGADYDDGLVELPMPLAGVDDTAPPKLLGARARDSESVLLSFDELVDGSDATIRVTSDAGDLAIVETLVGQPLPNQIVVRTAAMALDAAYTAVVAGVADRDGNSLATPVTVGFTSPAGFAPFTPIVDEDPPQIASVAATAPTTIEVAFAERVGERTADVENYALSHREGGAAPTVVSSRLIDGGRTVVLTTTPQERQAPYRVRVSNAVDVAGNVATATDVDFAGFGEFVAPEIEWARAVTPNRVAVKWNEPVTPETAGDLAAYAIDGLTIQTARHGGATELVNAAFNAPLAPFSTDLVILSTSTMAAGTTYTIDAAGVQDLSGNDSAATATFAGIASAPTVDVFLTYLISTNATVVGTQPGRALSPAQLDEQREGVFVLGTALTEDGSQPVASHPFTQALGGFPSEDEGGTLEGVEEQLKDDGTQGDEAAGDRVYTLRVPGVPLGSTLSWKAIASYSTAYRDASGDPFAAFADAQPGPFNFSDGQEFPGNDDAAYLVADLDGDGKIHLENLYGDEITFKRKTGSPAFHLVVDRARRAE